MSDGLPLDVPPLDMGNGWRRWIVRIDRRSPYYQVLVTTGGIEIPLIAVPEPLLDGVHEVQRRILDGEAVVVMGLLAHQPGEVFAWRAYRRDGVSSQELFDAEECEKIVLDAIDDEELCTTLVAFMIRMAQFHWNDCRWDIDHWHWTGAPTPPQLRGALDV